MEVVDRPSGIPRPREAHVILLEHSTSKPEDSDDAGKSPKAAPRGGRMTMEERVPRDRPVAVEEGVQGENMRRIRNRVRVVEQAWVWMERSARSTLN